jgi:hypothetical protein
MKNVQVPTGRTKSSVTLPRHRAWELCTIVLCLAIVLGLLFFRGFLPDRTVFSNDGPLGAISAACSKLPGSFMGYWQDLNWLGSTGPNPGLTLTTALGIVCGPVLFSKLYAPLGLLFLGLAAWFCFRQWKQHPVACILGALAAALNSDFFSTACWGLASQPIAFGFDFLALAALADDSGRRRWLKVTLAGFAVGLSVMEAFDIGAIFSLVIAAFVVYQAFVAEGPAVKRLVQGVVRVGLVAVFAGFIAAAALITLVGTQIQGVAGMKQDTTTKEQHWMEATLWSLPKREALDILIPGIYGFRMDTPNGGAYWGAGGRSPAWDAYFASGEKGPPPQAPLRFSGGGHYAGILVDFIALWAVMQSFRKEKSVFSARQRKFIWFWGGVAVISLLLAFGRFAPFYQFFYALPYASTIRNPAKFIHVFEWALIILFAYGLDALARRCLEPAGATAHDLSSQLKAWWTRAAAFDRRWVIGSAMALGIGALGWLVYAASRDHLVAYLQQVGFDDASSANTIASFSIRQPLWFLLFLALAAGLVTLALSGYFSGRRARTASVLFGLLLVIDLGRANVPWVKTYNWKERYASDPVLDILRQKPYEHRVAVLPFAAPGQLGFINQFYSLEWAQQQFQYYNIQSLDVVQMPRPPLDTVAYKTALQPGTNALTIQRLTRLWELTNTRYLIGAAGYLHVLNQQLDPVKHRFRIAAAFDIGLKPGVEHYTGTQDLAAYIKPNGPYALFEFTGALPRARLYSTWQVSTNDQATLEELPNPAFDPHKTVLVAEPVGAPKAAGANQPPETVDWVSYAPKDVVLSAKASAPSVLLLNDRFDPNWHVTIDGKPALLLRCNYIMQGVKVPPGEHRVEFRFAPSPVGLYVSLAAIGVGLCLLGFLIVSGPEREPEERREKRATTPDRQTQPAA